MRHMLVVGVLLLVAAVLAQNAEEGDGIHVDLQGELSRKKRDAPAVYVQLKDAGRLQVKDGEEWKNTTLKKLGEFLHRAKEKYHFERHTKGGSGYESLPGGAKGVSKLFISVEADPATPWLHLEWLMTVALEQKYYKLEFSDGKRRMLAFLPTNWGIQPIPAEPPNEVLVRFHVLARAEKSAKWGDATVMRPTKVLYRFADRQSADPAWLPRFIKNAKKAAVGEANTIVVGEVKAGHKVPFGKVFDVLQAFLDQDVTKARFFGLKTPSAAVRRRTRLPYPVKNYDTPD